MEEGARQDEVEMEEEKAEEIAKKEKENEAKIQVNVRAWMVLKPWSLERF